MSYREDTFESRCQLGVNIKMLRKQQRLSQTKLALMIGRDRSYISRIERGLCNATFDTIVVIANGLGIAPASLFAGIAEPDRPEKPVPVALSISRHR